VLALGAQAGAGAGAVAAGVLLLVSGGGAGSLRLLRLVGQPAVGALSGGVVLGCAQWSWAFLPSPIDLTILGEGLHERFTIVWVTHHGIYGGALLGLALACHRARGLRRESAGAFPER